MEGDRGGPHTGRLAKRLERAKDLEGRLRDEGRYADAEVIRALRLSASSGQGMLKSLISENNDLRRSGDDRIPPRSGRRSGF